MEEKLFAGYLKRKREEAGFRSTDALSEHIKATIPKTTLSGKAIKNIESGSNTPTLNTLECIMDGIGMSEQERHEVAHLFFGLPMGIPELTADEQECLENMRQLDDFGKKHTKWAMRQFVLALSSKAGGSQVKPTSKSSRGSRRPSSEAAGGGAYSK